MLIEHYCFIIILKCTETSLLLNWVRKRSTMLLSWNFWREQFCGSKTRGQREPYQIKFLTHNFWSGAMHNLWSGCQTKFNHQKNLNWFMQWIEGVYLLADIKDLKDRLFSCNSEIGARLHGKTELPDEDVARVLWSLHCPRHQLRLLEIPPPSWPTPLDHPYSHRVNETPSLNHCWSCLWL